MSSAAEARFRVQAPNSLPRAVKVVALDAHAEPAVRRLETVGAVRPSLFVASTNREQVELRDLAGRPVDLDGVVDNADMVVLVAAPGGHAGAAAALGRACSVRRVMTTGFILGALDAPPVELSATLAQIRPWSLMLVLAGDDSYIEDMMTALRA